MKQAAHIPVFCSHSHSTHRLLSTCLKHNLCQSICLCIVTRAPSYRRPPFLHRCGCNLHWLAIQLYAASQLGAPTKQQPSFATNQRVSVTTTCTVSICKSLSTPLELLSSELYGSPTALSPTLEASSWLTLYRVNWSSTEISVHASTRQITGLRKPCLTAQQPWSRNQLQLDINILHCLQAMRTRRSASIIIKEQ